MNNDLLEEFDNFYRLNEVEAEKYFNLLYSKINEKSYVKTLKDDINSWKKSHTPSYVAFLSKIKSKKPSTKNYKSYIQWLDYTGELDNYLDRSISYIFIRDLGKGLNDNYTVERINNVVKKLKNHLTNFDSKDENIDISKLYRKAQEEGIEETVIWLIDKLNNVFSNIPSEIDGENAKRKLIKIIAGVLMHEIEEKVDNESKENRAKRFSEAIRLGYYYGLTYPFIDDILDSNILSYSEKRDYSNLIRTTLITGIVPEIDKWNGENEDLIKYIRLELKEGFEYIKKSQRKETSDLFFKKSYVFFNSQEVDRIKNLSNEKYTNKEIYVPIILKSAFSRLITKLVINSSDNDKFNERTFLYGIYNQLADDFTDMFDDMKNGSVTPYTYYTKHYSKRKDLINPFELYWTVIYNLIHNVYDSNEKTCEVILCRAINGLKRFKEKHGEEKYNETMKIFSLKDSELNSLIQSMVDKADNIDFFDKLIRDHIISILKNESKEKDEFLETIENIKEKINKSLNINYENNFSFKDDIVINAANYSLGVGGKRLRPIITWFMGVREYGFNEEDVFPLLKSLEYMHTASLVFDDLPAQDNADIRRGYETLHKKYNVATAELTGLFLTQKAIFEQTFIKSFDLKCLLEVIRYSSEITCDMCKGQVLDLESKGKSLTLEQLNKLCFYKTGKAFEASLITPSILAKIDEKEIKALKKYSYHAGIAFQIKDDLLDVEGNSSLIGKSLGKDFENNSSTFVSILGKEGAKKQMWEHYCLAIESLQNVSKGKVFLKHLLNYIINRDH